MDDLFEPQTFKVSKRVDDPFVKLTFARDDDSSREVAVPSKHLPTLINLLQKTISPDQHDPTAPLTLQVGAQYQLKGFKLNKLPDGGALLTAYVTIPGEIKGVTFPLHFSQKDVETILVQLLVASS